MLFLSSLFTWFFPSIQAELFPSLLMDAFSFSDRTGLLKLRLRSLGQSVFNRVTYEINDRSLELNFAWGCR